MDRQKYPRLVFLAAIGLSGCGSVPVAKVPVAQTTEQVANVYVSAYPEIPWADISAALIPGRNLKIGDAQTLAINTTAAQSSLVSTLLAGGLAITLPGKSAPAATATSTAPTAPTQPAAPTLPAAIPVAATAPTLSPLDGADLLVAGTSLFQQSAIIDGQITKQYLPLGYTAHLLTFQVNIQPLRRDWSYDAYVDITLLPSPWSTALDTSNLTHGQQAGLPAVIVKPLIIMDALETTSIENSIQQIHQALLQLSGMISGVGLGGSLGSGSNIQHQGSGYDKNSLVTAGRVSDSTIRVRLGAESVGGERPVLVPRTYNISLFVLTRTWDPADPEGGDIKVNAQGVAVIPKPVKQLAAITGAYFAPADGSSVTKDVSDRSFYLKSSYHRSRPLLAARVNALLKQYGYPSVRTGCARAGAGGDADFDDATANAPNDLDGPLDLLRAVDRGDFVSVKDCLGIDKYLVPTDEEKLLFFVADMSEIQTSAHHSVLAVPLKDTTPRLPDPGQFALVSDSSDGTQETVTLRGGSYLNIDQVYPRAKFSLADGQTAWILPTSKIFLSPPGAVPELDMVFAAPTSLSPLKASNTAISSAPDSGFLSSVEVVLGIDTGKACNTPTHGCYLHLARAASSTAKGGAPAASCASSAKPIAITATTLRPSYSAGTGYSSTLNIAVGDVAGILTTCATPPPLAVGTSAGTALAGPLSLTVSGADVTVPTGTCLTQTNNQIQLANPGKCIATLTLSNLSAESPVTFSVTDSKSTAAGAPISLRVIDASQKP